MQNIPHFQNNYTSKKKSFQKHFVKEIFMNEFYNNVVVLLSENSAR